MRELERERKKKERDSKRDGGWGDGGGAMGASFQVSNTTSGDGFKPNSLPPINTQAEREYINCLTITHLKKREKRTEGGRKEKVSIRHCFFFIIRQNYKQKLK